MWPFIFILALVPMLFIWGDAVREVFPALDEWLPGGKKALEQEQLLQNQLTTPIAVTQEALSNQWIVSDTQEGFVAWTLSSDQRFRLAVGCYPGAPATVQVTNHDGSEVGKMIALNYQYGHLPLTQGVYSGPELVGAVAQFAEVYLQTPAGAVLAQFSVPAYMSGGLARQVESVCVPSQPLEAPPTESEMLNQQNLIQTQ